MDVQTGNVKQILKCEMPKLWFNYLGKDGNLEYENLEPWKVKSRINLECCWGRCGGVWSVGVGDGIGESDCDAYNPRYLMLRIAFGLLFLEFLVM